VDVSLCYNLTDYYLLLDRKNILIKRKQDKAKEVMKNNKKGYDWQADPAVLEFSD